MEKLLDVWGHVPVTTVGNCGGRRIGTGPRI